MIINMVSPSAKIAVKYKVIYIILVMLVVVLAILAEVVVVLVLLTDTVVVLVLLGVVVVIPPIVVKIAVDPIVEVAPGLIIVRAKTNAAIAMPSRRVARRDKSIHAGEHWQQ